MPFEVKRKFVPNALLLSKSLIQPSGLFATGYPRFATLEPTSSTTFRDIYYDLCPDWPLSQRGYWLRSRNGAWCLKRNLKGGGAEHYQNARYQEIRGLDQIRDELRAVLGENFKKGNERLPFGLDVLCDMTTRRKQFLIDGKFTLSIDEMGFGTFGQLELETKNEGEVPALDARLADFMQRHAWFFYREQGPEKKFKGKMEVFFDLYGRGGAQRNANDGL
ncbi:hypothetical protein BC830DRAFT_1079408 [Chytriomyces sp. MP71]|nr:hypothetical protein BC830DRAFT_1079408 [Chytriomyces sp. MP71]